MHSDTRSPWSALGRRPGCTWPGNKGIICTSNLNAQYSDADLREIYPK
jgi:hypothetical protein